MAAKAPYPALNPIESLEQQWLFIWAELEKITYPCLELMHHIPNEGKRSRATGRRMQAAGLKKGFPDICLPVACGRYHSLYIELKRVRGSYLSDDQIKWLNMLSAQGNCVAWCQGHENATKVILEYLHTGTITYHPGRMKGGEYLA